MSLGTLTIDLAANVAGLESDLGKAQRVWDKNIRDFERSAANTVKVAAGISAAITVGFAAMVKSSIDAADNLMDVSESSGIAVEKLSALKLATDIEGIALEQVSASLNKFSKTVDDAADGAGAGAESFAALGINVRGVDGALKDNYTLIEEVAEALSGLENGAQKTALAQELFGKSGVKLLPILNGGRQGLEGFSKEAERMRKIITTQTAQDAGRFNDNMNRLRESITGLSAVVAGEVTDDLADFTDVLADPEFQRGIASIATGIVSIGTAATGAVRELTIFGKVLGEEIARISNGIDVSNLTDVYDQIDKVRSALENPTERIRFFGKNGWVEYFSEEELQSELSKLLKQRDELLKNNPSPPLISSPQKDNGPKANTFVEYETNVVDFIDDEIEARARLQTEIQKSFDAQNAGYARQIALAGEVTELERIRYETTLGSLTQLDAKQKLILENQAREIDQIQRAAKAEADRKAADEKLTTDLEGVRQTLLTQEEALTKEAERRAQVLSDAHRARKIDDEEFAEAMRRNGEIAKREMDELAKKNDELAEITQELYRGVQNSIADALVTGIKGGGENALEAFRDLLIRMAAEAAAADLTRWIFGGEPGKSDGSTPGIISGIAGLFGGGRAVGGPVQGNKIYEVGENNNPELFYVGSRQYMIPGNNGSVVPGVGGGGVSINIDMRGATNSREIRESAGAVARKVSSAVMAAQRYN